MTKHSLSQEILDDDLKPSDRGGHFRSKFRWIIWANLCLLLSIGCNLWYSNFTTVGERQPPWYFDLITRTGYTLSGIFALIGIIGVLWAYHSADKVFARLVFPILLVLIPIFVLISQLVHWFGLI